MSRGFTHLSSQRACGAGAGGAPTTGSPDHFSGSAPRPLPSREGRLRDCWTGFRPTGPSGECHSREFPTVNTWERRGDVASSPPEVLRISSARPPSRLPHHPPAFLTTLSSPVLPPSVLTAWVPQLRLFSLPSSARPPSSNSSQDGAALHRGLPPLQRGPAPFPAPPPPPISRAASKSRWAQGVMQPWATLGTVRGPAWAPQPLSRQEPPVLLSAEAQAGSSS